MLLFCRQFKKNTVCTYQAPYSPAVTDMAVSSLKHIPSSSDMMVDDASQHIYIAAAC